MASIFDSEEVGKMHITINAEFHVDKKTADICAKLLGLYATQQGLEGIIVDNNNDLGDEPTVTYIPSMKTFASDIYYFYNYCKKKEVSE